MLQYYYLGETPAEVPIPQDFRILAGSASATTADDSPADAKVEWFCEGDDGISADVNGFPSSTCSTHLQTLLYFPQCVNVDTLETAYKSRSYGTENYCPEGSSSMPQLRFSIRYDLRDAQNMVAATSDKRTYASVNGALGNDGEQPNCKATDADPDHGTSDYAESVAAMGKRSVDTMGWQSRSRFRSTRRNWTNTKLAVRVHNLFVDQQVRLSA